MRLAVYYEQGSNRYVKLSIGDKRVFNVRYDEHDLLLVSLITKHAHVLFSRRDEIDRIITNTPGLLAYTSNYSIKSRTLNKGLTPYIFMNRLQDRATNSFAYSIRHKNLTRQFEDFVLTLNKEQPKIICQGEDLIPTINIVEQNVPLNERAVTDDLFLRYIMADKERFNRYLNTQAFKKDLPTILQQVHFSIKDIEPASEKKPYKTITLSYQYPQRDITIELALPSNTPSNINNTLKTQYIVHFNSFDFNINGSKFLGYQQGKTVYGITQDICNDDKNIEIFYLSNNVENEKWQHTITTNKITFTPNYNMILFDTKPSFFAMDAKTHIDSEENEQRHLQKIADTKEIKGNIAYLYNHGDTLFRSQMIIEQSNSPFYFQYPQVIPCQSVHELIKKANMFLDNQKISLKYGINVNCQEQSIKDRKITINESNKGKIALIYMPANNVDGFRSLFLNPSTCEITRDSEGNIVVKNKACQDARVHIQSLLAGIASKLTQAYNNVLYRQLKPQSQSFSNLIIYKPEDFIFVDDEVLWGKQYTQHTFGLKGIIKQDKGILTPYHSSVDLFYLAHLEDSADELGVQNSIKTLKNSPFNHVYVINFGQSSFLATEAKKSSKISLITISDSNKAIIKAPDGFNKMDNMVNTIARQLIKPVIKPRDQNSGQTKQ